MDGNSSSDKFINIILELSNDISSSAFIVTHTDTASLEESYIKINSKSNHGSISCGNCDCSFEVNLFIDQLGLKLEPQIKIEPVDVHSILDENIESQSTKEDVSHLIKRVPDLPVSAWLNRKKSESISNPPVSTLPTRKQIWKAPFILKYENADDATDNFNTRAQPMDEDESESIPRQTEFVAFRNENSLTQPRIFKRVAPISQLNLTEIKRNKIIRSKSLKPIITHEQYEELYFQKRNKTDFSFPYLEIMTFPNDVTLYFMKLSIGKNFYMTNFDLRPGVCDLCGFKFKGGNTISLIQHRLLHFVDRPDQTNCVPCGWAFETREELARHVLVCTQKDKVAGMRCKHCGKQFENFNTLRKHEQKHFPELLSKSRQTLICEICSMSVMDAYALQTHLRREHYIDPFECAHCEKVFGSLPNLKRHLFDEHFPQLSPDYCQPCGRTFMTSIPDDKIIYSKSEEAILTHEQYEQLYFQKQSKGGKVYPYFEIMKFPNDVTLYFMRYSRKKSFHMTNFDPRLGACDLCSFKINDESAFFKHRNLHFVEVGDTTCTPCGKTFATRKEVLRHVSVCPQKHKVAGMRCKHCGKKYTSSTGLRLHERSHVPEFQRQSQQPQMCEHCSETFKDAKSLRYHIRKDHKIDAFECQHCQRTFGELMELKRHLFIKHFPQLAPFSCAPCGMSFTARRVFEIHNHFKHSNDSIEVCKICGKSVKVLKNHLKKVHRNVNELEKFYCLVCGKMFFSKSSLEDHELGHKDPEEWKFKCETCDKKFPRQSALALHRKKHSSSGSRPTCTVCQKSFSSAQYLKDHMNLHTGERPYKCKVCEKGFADRGCLRSHLKVHESNMGVKLVLNPEEARLKRLGLLDDKDKV